MTPRTTACRIFFFARANPPPAALSISFTHFARRSSEFSGASRPPPAAGLGAVRRKASLNHRAVSKDFTP
jgi:hypothetical protein